MPPLPRQPIAAASAAPAPSAVRLEQQRLAQVLHSTVCQELTGACFLAGAAAHRYRGTDPEAGRRFDEIADLIQQAGAHLAEIVHSLHGPPED